MADDVIRSGRRFVFTNAEELRLKIKQYFDLQDPHTESKLIESGHNGKGEKMFGTEMIITEQKPYTVTGLARNLGVARSTINNYRDLNHYTDEISEETRQELMDAIEDAYQRVEEFNEGQLHKSGIANGVKFNLVNNFDWADKQVVEHTSVEDDLDDLDKETAEDDIAEAAKQELGEDGPSGEPGSQATE